jgi:tRNA threonylcarbamoyladenosine biosynthesis protein TsaB
MDAKMPRESATRQPRSGTGWRVLAFDTCFARCAVALAEQRAGDIVPTASLVQDMTRGHAAMLAPMIKQALREAKWRPSDLDLVALTIGPGSFTGVRIGVATARGLAMSLRCPIAGVATTAALRLGATREDCGGMIVIALESGRGDFFLALQNEAPFAATAESAAVRLKDCDAILVGDGAQRLGNELRRLGVRADVGTSSSSIDMGLLAGHALSMGIGHWASANERDGLPRPIYLRGADVTLASGARTTADLRC